MLTSRLRQPIIPKKASSLCSIPFPWKNAGSALLPEAEIVSCSADHAFCVLSPRDTFMTCVTAEDEQGAEVPASASNSSGRVGGPPRSGFARPTKALKASDSGKKAWKDEAWSHSTRHHRQHISHDDNHNEDAGKWQEEGAGNPWEHKPRTRTFLPLGGWTGSPPSLTMPPRNSVLIPGTPRKWANISGALCSSWDCVWASPLKTGKTSSVMAM